MTGSEFFRLAAYGLQLVALGLITVSPVLALAGLLTWLAVTFMGGAH